VNETNWCSDAETIYEVLILPPSQIEQLKNLIEVAHSNIC